MTNNLQKVSIIIINKYKNYKKLLIKNNKNFRYKKKNCKLKNLKKIN